VNRDRAFLAAAAQLDIEDFPQVPRLEKERVMRHAANEGGRAWRVRLQQRQSRRVCSRKQGKSLRGCVQQPTLGSLAERRRKKNMESAITRRNRRTAKRLGYRICKGRGAEHLNNRGGFQIIEEYHNTVVFGADFNATEEAVSDFLSGIDAKSRGVAA
jgi:hypothetical protein